MRIPDGGPCYVGGYRRRWRRLGDAVQLFGRVPLDHPQTDTPEPMIGSAAKPSQKTAIYRRKSHTGPPYPAPEAGLKASIDEDGSHDQNRALLRGG